MSNIGKPPTKHLVRSSINLVFNNARAGTFGQPASAVIGRPSGAWQGTLEWSRSRIDDPDSRELDAWLAELHGGANTFDVPLAGRKNLGLAGQFGMIMRVASVNGNDVILAFSDTGSMPRKLFESSPIIYAKGDMINVGSSIVIVTKPFIYNPATLVNTSLQYSPTNSTFEVDNEVTATNVALRATPTRDNVFDIGWDKEMKDRITLDWVEALVQ